MGSDPGSSGGPMAAEEEKIFYILLTFVFKIPCVFDPCAPVTFQVWC